MSTRSAFVDSLSTRRDGFTDRTGEPDRMLAVSAGASFICGNDGDDDDRGREEQASPPIRRGPECRLRDQAGS